MQRVRMSLSYFKDFGYECEVMTVDEKRLYPMEKDDLLLQSIPNGIKIHKISASSSFGFMSSIGLRSFWSYRKNVNRLLATRQFDLVYFSTTQFPVCALGSTWQKKFKVPYVIDMQDPWYTGRYKIKGTAPKYKLVYLLHRFLEKAAMSKVAGLISVSPKYIDDLSIVYARLKNVQNAVIPFGALEKDFEIALKNRSRFKELLDNKSINIVCAGRGGGDLYPAIEPIFKALANNKPLYNKVKFYFIGTSYAPAGNGKPSIMPLAQQYGVEDNVLEYPERIGYYHTLLTLQQADALFIPGSDDVGYNASKIHPYVLTKKPILSISHPNSPMMQVLKEYNVADTYSFDQPNLDHQIESFLRKVMNHEIDDKGNAINKETVIKYSAQNMTRRQCELFDNVLSHYNK